MATYNAYPQEIIDFVREYGPQHTIAETAEAVTEKFGRTMTYPQARAFFSNHHIHAAPRTGRPGYTHYPAGMLDYIREIAKGRTKYEIADLVNEKFGPGTITPRQVHAYKKNHKITTGLTGQFQKGQAPPNKGKKWDEFIPPESQARSRATTFKTGNRPHNWKPVGSERINVDGYVEVKVAEPKTWMAKHRLIWEEHYGPVPENHVVIFKDGDKLNLDIDNLALISRALHARMNHMGIMAPGIEAFDTAVAVAGLAAEAGRLKKERRKHDRVHNAERRDDTD